MANFLFRMFGGRLAKKVAHRQSQAGGWLELHLGFALLKDRRVPVKCKFLALAAGVGVVAVLLALEIPLQGVVALLVPMLGFVSDAMIDGLEVVAGPLLVAAALLPRLAPQEVVQAIRAEDPRASAIQGVPRS